MIECPDVADMDFYFVECELHQAIADEILTRVNAMGKTMTYDQAPDWLLKLSAEVAFKHLKRLGRLHYGPTQK